MLRLRNKNHLPIPIPLLEKDFNKVPKLQKRLEMQDGEESVNVDYILFDNQFKKEIKNDSLRDRLLTIKQNLQSRNINVKNVETYTVDDLLRNEWKFGQINLWRRIFQFVVEARRPLLPERSKNSNNEVSIKDGIFFKFQLIAGYSIPISGVMSSHD